MEFTDQIKLKAEADGKLVEVETEGKPTFPVPEEKTETGPILESIPEPKKLNPPVFYDTLVLSGGSTKGILTLGAIQYAFDHYLLKNVKTYIGTSSGSMIGYLLAIGYTPIEIMVYVCTNQIMEKMQHLNIVDMIQGRGASSFNNIQEQIEKMTISKIGYLPTLNDLREKYGKTLICVTHNITENCTEYLSWETYPNLPCVTAIRMSANLPLIFETYKYGDSFYIDGGISDNFAIDIGDQRGEKVLGIVLNPDQGNFSSDPDVNTLEFIYKLMFIPISQAMEYKIGKVSEKCQIIRINHNKMIKFFQFNVSSKVKLEMFSSGYEQMKNIME